MSAIAGLIHFDGRPMTDGALEPVMRALAALGPDRQACWRDGMAALGVRVMALLPEDRFDRQPWVERDGTLVMVADARIDNRDELARVLGLGANSLRSMSDSEMLLATYERWGTGGFDRIVGEFTFAAWDARERRLCCARSHLGGSPLYYHRSQHRFAFASTAGALLALPDTPRVLNERRLACALALLPGEPQESFYRDISCLPPGHCLSVEQGRVSVERYWRLDIERRIRLPSDADYVEAFRETFQQAVAARLRSIYPIGSDLSSGCDSSAVTATAAHLLAAEGGGLTAFTAAPREGYAATAPFGWTLDESALAARVAAGLPNLAHVVVRPNGRTALDRLDRSHMLYGRPPRNPANFDWIERVLDTARDRGIRVQLTGERGNKTISYHGLSLLKSLLRSGRWLALAREARALKNNGFGYRGTAEAALGPDLSAPLRRLHRRLAARPTMNLAAYSAINPAFAAEIGVEAMARRQQWQIGLEPKGDGRARRRAFIEAAEAGDYRDGVRAGWGIETRDPTGDRRVVEFCLAIPEDQFLRNGQRKFLYRRAFEPVLPTAEMVVRKRGYQAADWHEGLTASRGRVAAELDRMARSAAARRALDLPRLKHLVENWPSGDWQGEEVRRQYRHLLMRAVAAGMFILAAEGRRESQAGS